MEYNEYGGPPDEFERMQELSAASGPFEEHVPQFNSVTLVGRLGSDPEARYFESGSVVVNIGLAVERKYDPVERQILGIRYGEEETSWFALEIWGKDAEYVANYATKGARVGVTGQIVIDSWINKQSGDLRTKPTIIVDTIDILETRAESQLRRKGGGQQRSQYQNGGSNKRYNNDFDDNGLADNGYSTGFRVDDDSPKYPPSAGSGNFFD